MPTGAHIAVLADDLELNRHAVDAVLTRGSGDCGMPDRAGDLPLLA